MSHLFTGRVAGREQIDIVNIIEIHKIKHFSIRSLTFSHCPPSSDELSGRISSPRWV